MPPHRSGSQVHFVVSQGGSRKLNETSKGLRACHEASRWPQDRFSGLAGKFHFNFLFFHFKNRSHQRRSQEHLRVRETGSTERMIRREVQLNLEGEERNMSGNAAARNPSEYGTNRSRIADPPISGE